MVLTVVSQQDFTNSTSVVYFIFISLGVVALAAVAWGIFRANAGGATVKALQDLTDAQDKTNHALKDELADLRTKNLELATDLKVLQRQVSGADAVIRMEKRMNDNHKEVMAAVAPLSRLDALIDAIGRLADARQEKKP